MPASNTAWICVQLAELLRAAEDRLLEAIAALGPDVHAGITADTDLKLSAEETTRLNDAIAEATDLCDQLASLAEPLPNAGITIAYEAVRDGAVADLTKGIVDPRRAAIAAQVLDIVTGWAALATAFTTTDTAKSWDEITLAELLGRCRGADQRLVRRVIGQAGLTPDLDVADVPYDGFRRLADVLRNHADSTTA